MTIILEQNGSRSRTIILGHKVSWIRTIIFGRGSIKHVNLWPRITCWRVTTQKSMIGENWQLVTYEPVEIEKLPVEVHECRKIIDGFGGIYMIYPNLIKENRRMSTCTQLDLQTLGSQPVMPKNLPDHCPKSARNHSFTLGTPPPQWCP